jgi:hypothetical protein
MKSLFKKRETAFTYHKYYMFLQEKWAQKMNVLTEGLSRKKLSYLLVLFTVLTAGYLIYNIYAAFSKSNSLRVNNTAVITKIKSITIKK